MEVYLLAASDKDHQVRDRGAFQANENKTYQNKPLPVEPHSFFILYPTVFLYYFKLRQIQICYSLYYYKTPSQFSTLGKCVGYDPLSIMRNIPVPQSQIVMIVEDGEEN